MSQHQTDQEQQLFAMRHSLAHIMATAIAELYPGVKFGGGPVVEHGHYYDCDATKAITVADVGTIEHKLQQLAKSDTQFGP